MIAKRKSLMATLAKKPGIYRINLTSVLSAHHFKNLLITMRSQNDSIEKEEKNHATESLLSQTEMF